MTRTPPEDGAGGAAGRRPARIGTLIGATTATAVVAVVTLPFAFALLRAGSTSAAVLAGVPVLLVAVTTFGRALALPEAPSPPRPPVQRDGSADDA